MLNKGDKDRVAELITATSGPSIKALAPAKNPPRRLVVTFGLIVESSIMQAQFEGQLEDALDVYVSWLKAMNPEALADTDTVLLKTRLKIEATGAQLDAQGTPHQTGRVTLHARRLVLKEVMAVQEVELPDNAAWKPTRKVQWRKVIDGNARLGVIGLLLDTVGISQLAGQLDEQTTLANRIKENRWRYRAAMMSAVGGVGELVHDGIMKGAAVSARLSRAAASVWLKVLGGTSRLLGFGGAAIVALWGAYHGIHSFKQDHVGMAVLYFGSAVTGLGTFFAFTAAAASSSAVGAAGVVLGLSAVAFWTGIGIVLLLAGVAINVLIAVLHTNQLQEWMARCRFGNKEKERYETPEEEMDQFEVAMKALGADPEDNEETRGVLESSPTPEGMPQGASG